MSPPTATLDVGLGLQGIGNLLTPGSPVGVHLRWGFEPEYGFPDRGFRLFRRLTRKNTDPNCLQISAAQLAKLLQDRWISISGASIQFQLGACPVLLGAAARSSVACRRFDIELDEAVLLRHVSLQGAKQAMVIALAGGRPVAVKQQTAGAVILMDGVVADGIVIYTRHGGPSAVCFERESDLQSGDWTDNLLPQSSNGEFGYGLPLTHDDYNLLHQHVDPANPAAGDLQEAGRRLTEFDAAIVEAEFLEMRSSLGAMVDQRIPGRMFDREVFRTAEDTSPFFERPLDLSLLAALDARIARILGLYFVDREVKPGEAYDYLLMGDWSRWQLSRPAKVFSFATVAEGAVIPRLVGLCGTTIHLPVGSRVQSNPRDDGRPSRKALRVRQSSFFHFAKSPLTIRFNEPMRWVVLEFGRRAQGLLVSSQFFGVPLASVAVGPGGPTRVVIDPGPGLLELEIKGSEFQLYGFRGYPLSAPDLDLEEMDQSVRLGTILFDFLFEQSPPLSSPSNLRLRGVPMPTAEQPDLPLRSDFPIENPDPQGLGLRWDPPVAADAVRWPADFDRRLPTEAAGYNIRYQNLGDGETPQPVDPGRWEPALDVPIAISPPAVAGDGPRQQPVRRGDDLCERFPAREPPRPSEFPADADMWVQPWLPEGWYAASVQTRDVFGRFSDWHDGGPALADAIPNPPPPANVEAKLLQLDDPELTAAELALANLHGDGCIQVTWQWPPQMRRQAPHAASFRVYVKRAVFNQFPVRVVAIGPGARTELVSCTIETDVPLEADSLATSSLVDQGLIAFRIVANTAGTTSAVSLQRRLDASHTPAFGDAEIRLVDQIAVRVVSAADGPAPDQISCSIHSRTALAAGSLVDGTLIDEAGSAYRVLSNAGGTSLGLTLQRPADQPDRLPAGRSTLSIAAGISLYEDPAERSSWEARVATVSLTSALDYQAVIPPLEIVADGERPIRRATVGVSTTDDSVRVGDSFPQPLGTPWDSSLGGLKGREGKVSPPVRIVSIFRQPEPLPDAVVPDRVFSSPPDFFGRSRYELRWPNVPSSRRRHTSWNVWRTTDRALLALFDPDPAQSEIDVSGMTVPAQAELATAHAAGRADLIGDAVIQELAQQPNADQALVAANESPLNSSAEEMAFVDIIDGKNQVRYLYRLRTENKAGLLSPLSDASLPVYIPNTFPPTPMRILACEGGERLVRLVWKPNPEPDVGGYLVFSNEDGLTLGELEQLRVLRRPIDSEHGEIEVYDREGNLIAPTQRVTKSQADSMMVEGEIVLVREELAGGELFHYRLAAFDSAGNVSEWSPVFSARTTGIERPEHPQWNDPVPAGALLNLSWTASRDDLNCLVQKRVGGGDWTNLTGWLGRGNYAVIDSGHVPAAATQFRLRVLFPNGQINQEFTVLDVPEIES